jgi:hypothetical protein
MRSIPVAMATLLVALASTTARAQVMQLPAAAPQVTAAGADWQLRGDPVFFAGDFYYPTGPNVFFDGFVMVRSGSYRGIPLYEDTSIEPYRIVYVPIGRSAMRPYERRSVGELAGPAGSRAPWVPIQHDAEWPFAAAGGSGATPMAIRAEDRIAAESPRPAGTAVATSNVVRTRGVTPSSRPARLLVQSIPPPRSNAGFWIEFNAARWYSSGRAVPHVAGQFVRIGTYRGFPVYRDAARRSDEIYVPSVADGPLAPYSRP